MKSDSFENKTQKMRIIFLICVTAFLWDCCLANESLNCSAAECINNGNDDSLSQILCNTCLPKILSNRNVAVSLMRQIQRKIIYGDIRTIFTDLGVDVLYLILDELEFLDALNLLRAYQYCPDMGLSAAADAIFRKKYKDYEVHINVDKKSDFAIDANTKSINAYDYKICKNLLRHFGRVIQHLTIHNPPIYGKPNLNSIFMKYLNKYAVKSLTHLDLDYIEADAFTHFKNPFNELEDLSFNVCEDVMKTGNLSIQLFPKLRRLSVRLSRNLDCKFMFYEFPQLEQLNFFVTIRDWKHENKFETILQKALKIQNLKLWYISQHLCNIINKCLPKLENLTVGFIESVNDTSFMHVKYLEVRGRQENPVDGIIFPRLEYITVKHTGHIIQIWSEFFRKHRFVKHLTIVDIDINTINVELEYHQRDFHQLVMELPNLTEITFEYSNEAVTLSADEVIEKTIRKNEKLKKFNLVAFRLKETELNALREKYENDWNMIINAKYEHNRRNVVDFSFEKKVVAPFAWRI